MVDSGTVKQHLESISKEFSSYDQSVGGLPGLWKGKSHDQFSSQAKEFSGDYLKTISSQMNAFAKACDLYEQYLTTKKNYKSFETSYNNAETVDEKKQYASEMSNCSKKLETLTDEIDEQLKNASKTSLEATPLSGSWVPSSIKDWSNDDNFVYYSQNHMPGSSDTWDNYKYSSGGSNTMSASGCGPTSMAMVMSSLGYDVTPNDTAEWSSSHGGHVSEGTAWGFFPSYASEMGVSCKQLGGHSTSNITESLEDGNLVIISAEAGDFTKNGHFIVARGYNPDTNEILIADPNHEDNNRWWDADRVAKQTAQCWAFGNVET